MIRVIKLNNEVREVLEDIIEEYLAFTLKQINIKLRGWQLQKPQVYLPIIVTALDSMLIKAKKLEYTLQDHNVVWTKSCMIHVLWQCQFCLHR